MRMFFYVESLWFLEKLQCRYSLKLIEKDRAE